jgi:hypothetical protein
MMNDILSFKSKAEKDSDSWNRIFAGAWEGFIKKGRGAFIFEPAPNMPGHSQLRFLEADNGDFKRILDDEDLPKLAELINNYDPQIQFVVVYDYGDSYEVKTLTADVANGGLTPPQAHELIRKQKQKEA